MGNNVTYFSNLNFLLFCLKKQLHTLKIFNSIKSKDVSRIEINTLIEVAQNFAFTYLKYRYKNLHKTLLAEDVTLNEIAIDAIAQLFERNDEGVFIKLKDAFEKWQPPIETEEKALFFLNRLVGKSVEKYISELLRDSDPFFSKILDSVNHQIEKHGYLKKQILGTTFVLEAIEHQHIGKLPDNLFILNLPSELFEDIRNLLPNIFEYLKNETDKEAAIPLNALVNKIKRIQAVNFRLTDKVELHDEITNESIIDTALKSSLQKLDESYFIKGKISIEEKLGIEAGLRNILNDLKDGGISPGLHKYFLAQFPNKSISEYQDNFQNIFEYLFKFLRKEIIKQLDGRA